MKEQLEHSDSLGAGLTALSGSMQQLVVSNPWSSFVLLNFGYNCRLKVLILSNELQHNAIVMSA